MLMTALRTEGTTERPPDNKIYHAPEVRRRNRRLWFGLANGPIIYSVYFIIGYFFAEATCTADLLRYRLFGLEAISFWIFVLTALCALVTGYSTMMAWRLWRQTRHNEEAADVENSYPPFLAFIGAWLSGFFTLMILLSGVPAYVLVICDWI